MLRNVAWAFGAQLVRLGTLLVLIALLSPAERGFQAIVVLLPTLATTVALLSVPGVLPVVLHRGVAPQRLFRAAWALALAMTVLVCALALTSMPVLIRYLQRQAEGQYLLDERIVWLGILVLIPLLLGEMVRGWLVSLQRVRAYAVSQIVQAVVQLLLTLVLVAWRGTGAWGAVWATVSATWVGLGVAMVALGDWGAFVPRFDRAALTPTLRLGLQAHLGNTVQLLNYQLDTLLIAGLLAGSAVGLYSIAVSLATQLWNVPNAVALVLLPHVAAGGARSTPAAARHTLLLALLGALALLGGSFALLALLNPAFLPAWPALVLLLPGVVALSVSKVLASDLGGRGLPRYATLGAAVAVLVTIPGDLLLIPRWGILGAAAVSTVAYSLSTVVIARAYVQVAGVSWRALWPGRAEWRVYGALAQRLLQGVIPRRTP